MNIQDSQYYFNRELSWLDFNYRVLNEAFDSRTPLLERLKFSAIFSSNLDEFFHDSGLDPRKLKARSPLQLELGQRSNQQWLN